MPNRLLYKHKIFDKNCFEVIMKEKWKNWEIKKLFELIETNQKVNKSMMESFREYAKLSNRNALSIRNFYYAQAKVLAENPALCKELGIDISNHLVQKFQHFDKKSEEKLKNSIENLKKEGISTRSACLKLSGGDVKNMLRLQNKYRSIMSKESAKVINFPTQNSTKNNIGTKLTDEDIKSLFMGLVKLVKENATSENKDKAEKFLEQTEKEKRRHYVELQEKQLEIEKLNQAINELKAKNDFLNHQLKNYRLDFVSRINNTDNFVNGN